MDLQSTVLGHSLCIPFTTNLHLRVSLFLLSMISSCTTIFIRQSNAQPKFHSWLLIVTLHARCMRCMRCIICLVRYVHFLVQLKWFLLSWVYMRKTEPPHLKTDIVVYVLFISITALLLLNYCCQHCIVLSTGTLLSIAPPTLALYLVRNAVTRNYYSTSTVSHMDAHCNFPSFITSNVYNQCATAHYCIHHHHTHAALRTRWSCNLKLET